MIYFIFYWIVAGLYTWALPRHSDVSPESDMIVSLLFGGLTVPVRLFQKVLS